ncbi:hypothetical protein [Paraburkholderia tropica]|uniref:hypothetical protein n=1 Tax=Paraburkholderia tropica TaxID=92647 RepID=UPI002AB674ED|nr:hypothetical protein [Paraburkholderia tropica]
MSKTPGKLCALCEATLEHPNQYRPHEHLCEAGKARSPIGKQIDPFFCRTCGADWLRTSQAGSSRNEIVEWHLK